MSSYGSKYFSSRNSEVMGRRLGKQSNSLSARSSSESMRVKELSSIDTRREIKKEDIKGGSNKNSKIKLKWIMSLIDLIFF